MDYGWRLRESYALSSLTFSNQSTQSSTQIPHKKKCIYLRSKLRLETEYWLWDADDSKACTINSTAKTNQQLNNLCNYRNGKNKSTV